MDQVFLSFSENEGPITKAVNSSQCQKLLDQCPSNILCLVNGKLFDRSSKLQQYDSVTLHPKLCGGKGGFGSMLRAIGAQIEATTNNDACRDLSGKRLRDVKCEKLMKDWAAKKATEKEDRKERKRQRLQNVLDRPSRIKAEDNTYISEMRSMSDSVEAAIATAIAEDEQVKHVTLPAPKKSKKWFDEDLDSSEEEEEEKAECGGSSTGEQQSSESSDQTDNEGDEQTAQHTGHVQSEKGEIKITFVDELDKADAVEENDNKDEAGTTLSSHVASSEEFSTLSENRVSPTVTAEEESSGKTVTPPEACTIEEVQAPTSDAKDWVSFETAEAMLGDLGADKIKNILSEMGLKCGGTPLARAERLYSVRNLPKEDIPASLFATSGKGRKRKVAEFVER